MKRSSGASRSVLIWIMFERRLLGSKSADLSLAILLIRNLSKTGSVVLLEGLLDASSNSPTYSVTRHSDMLMVGRIVEKIYKDVAGLFIKEAPGKSIYQNNQPFFPFKGPYQSTTMTTIHFVK